MLQTKKTCIQCKKSFPESEEYFHRSKDGLHGRCKKCRLRHEKGRRDKKTQKKLEDMERGAIDQFMSVARSGGANIPHSSELVECVMDYFGGVRGFSNAFMKQYFDSPAGGAFRTKMLDTIIRLVSANTAMGGAKKPLEFWSEDELEGELRQRLIETAITINALPQELANGMRSHIEISTPGAAGGSPDGHGRLEVAGGGDGPTGLPEDETEVHQPDGD